MQLVGMRMHGAETSQGATESHFLAPPCAAYAQQLQHCVQALAACSVPTGEALRAQLWRDDRRLDRELREHCAPVVAGLCQRWGIRETFELYDDAGADPAGIFPVPAALAVPAGLLTRCDAGALRAALAVRLADRLLHAASPDMADLSARAAMSGAEPGVAEAALRLRLLQRLQADRAVLGVSDQPLDEWTRAHLAALTGLPSWRAGALAEALRLQCQRWCAEPGDAPLPEHVLRMSALYAYAQHGAEADVETTALLMRVLPRESGELPYDRLELAAAAAVIAASADGALTAREIAVFESVFSWVLPDWRELLDLDVALDRFQSLVPLAVRDGPIAQHAVALLCAAVVLADGQANAEELDLLLAIGDACGALDRFRMLIAAHLEVLGLAHELPELPWQAVPAAIRAVDDEALLVSMFQSAIRGRGSRITPRRLLRILRHDQLDEAVCFLIAAAASRAGIVAHIDVAAPLHTPLRLQLPLDASGNELSVRLAGARQAADAGLASTKGLMMAVRRPLERMRQTLREQARTDIWLQAGPLASVPLAAFDSLGAGRSARALAAIAHAQPVVLMSAAEAVEQPRLHERLLGLQARQDTELQSAGRSAVALGYPMVMQYRGDRLLGCPLLLYPVLLQSAIGSPALAARPCVGERVRVHRGLLRELAAESVPPPGIALDDERLDALDRLAADGVSPVLRQLAAWGLVLTPPGVRGAVGAPQLSTEAVLGAWPTAAAEALPSFDALIERITEPAAVAPALATAGELLPAAVRRALPVAWRGTQAGTVTPVAAVGPSMAQALEQSRHRRCQVVEASAATGPDRYALSLVVDALARGERVAVVSTRAFALDALRAGLQRLDLADLSIDLADPAASRTRLKALLEVRAAREPLRATPAFRISAVESRLAALEEQQQVQAKRASDAVGGLPRAQLYTQAAGYSAAALPIPDSLPMLDRQALESLISLLLALWADLPLMVPGSPWALPRASLADLDAGAARARLEQLTAARAARQDWDQACAAAQVDDADALLAERASLQPWLARAASLADQLRSLGAPDLDDLAERLAEPSPEARAGTLEPAAGDSLNDLLAAREDVEQALADAGLQGRSDARLALEAAEAALRGVQSGQADRHSVPGSARFVMLMRAAQSFPEALDLLREASALWTTEREALLACGLRQRHEATEGLEAALQVIDDGIGDRRRWVSQEWWIALKRIHDNLAQHWPEKRFAKPERALIASIRQRLAATRAWQAIDYAAAALGMEASGLDEDAETVYRWLDRMWNDWARVSALREHEPLLRAVGAWPESTIARSLEQWEQRVEACLVALAAERQFQQRIDACRQRLALPEAAVGLPELQQQLVLRDSISALRAQQRRLQALKAWPEGGGAAALAAWQARLHTLASLLDKGEPWFAAAAALQDWLPQVSLSSTVEALTGYALAWRNDAGALQRFDRLRRQAGEVYADAEWLIGRIAGGCWSSGPGLAPADWPDGLRRAWTEALLAQEPPGPTSAELQAAHEEMERLLAERAELARLAARARQDRAGLLRDDDPAQLSRRSAVLAGAAQVEAGTLSLRAWIDDSWDAGLGEWMPLWLLHPEDLGLWPLRAGFDLMVVVEASQLHAEPGFLALTRAQRCVLIGDAQLSADRYDTAVDEQRIAPSVWALAQQGQEPAELRELLEPTAAPLEEWWQRAWPSPRRDRLPSPPAAQAAAVVSWEAWSDADEEAARAVELLHDALLSGEGSVGLLALEPLHRDRLLAQLRRRLSMDADFARLHARARLNSDRARRPFVGLPEDLQGERRDELVLCLGGLLPGEGEPAASELEGEEGEHRLRVALGVARQRLRVLAGRAPESIVLGAGAHRAPWLLLRLGQWTHALAQHGAPAARRCLDLVAADPLRQRRPRDADGLALRQQLALQLHARGWSVDTDVGLPPARLSLVIDGASPLAVLVDEDQLADAAARRRMLPSPLWPALLRQRGWQLCWLDTEGAWRARGEWLDRLAGGAHPKSG